MSVTSLRGPTETSSTTAPFRFPYAIWILVAASRIMSFTLSANDTARHCFLAPQRKTRKRAITSDQARKTDAIMAV